MSDARRAVGTAGEKVAAAFLARHGLRIVGRNVEVDRGELDLLALDRGRRVVVEVRSVTGREDPLRAFRPDKASQVARLARRVGAQRVDLVAVHLDDGAAELRWVKGAA